MKIQFDLVFDCYVVDCCLMLEVEYVEFIENVEFVFQIIGLVEISDIKGYIDDILIYIGVIVFRLFIFVM